MDEFRRFNITAVIDILKSFKFCEQAFISQINVRLSEMERATKDLKNNGKCCKGFCPIFFDEMEDL